MVLELVPVISAVAPVDTEEDLGLFGPTSATWRVHLEPVLWVGGIRALYLQALHPRSPGPSLQFSHQSLQTGSPERLQRVLAASAERWGIPRAEVEEGWSPATAASGGPD